MLFVWAAFVVIVVMIAMGFSDETFYHRAVVGLLCAILVLLAVVVEYMEAAP